MNWPRYIVGALLILILQLLASAFINIWPPLYIAIIPLFIILLPVQTDTYLLMFCGLAIGLLTDALSDGILGLNAAACTLLAACKNMIIRPMQRYDIQPEAFDLTSADFDTRKLITLLTFSYLVFFIAYIPLDSIGASSFLFMVFRLIINVVVNVIIAYLLERLWIRRLFS